MLQAVKVPQAILRYVQSFYSTLSVIISANTWETQPIPFRKGVFQGDTFVNFRWQRDHVLHRHAYIELGAIRAALKLTRFLRRKERSTSYLSLFRWLFTSKLQYFETAVS